LVPLPPEGICDGPARLPPRSCGHTFPPGGDSYEQIEFVDRLGARLVVGEQWTLAARARRVLRRAPRSTTPGNSAFARMSLTARLKRKLVEAGIFRKTRYSRQRHAAVNGISLQRTDKGAGAVSPVHVGRKHGATLLAFARAQRKQMDLVNRATGGQWSRADHADSGQRGKLTNVRTVAGRAPEQGHRASSNGWAQRPRGSKRHLVPFHRMLIRPHLT